MACSLVQDEIMVPSGENVTGSPSASEIVLTRPQVWTSHIFMSLIRRRMHMRRDCRPGRMRQRLHLLLRSWLNILLSRLQKYPENHVHIPQSNHPCVKRPLISLRNQPEWIWYNYPMKNRLRSAISLLSTIDRHIAFEQATNQVTKAMRSGIYELRILGWDQRSVKRIFRNLRSTSTV